MITNPPPPSDAVVPDPVHHIPLEPDQAVRSEPAIHDLHRIALTEPEEVDQETRGELPDIDFTAPLRP